MQEKEHVIEILEKAKKSIKEEDILKIRDLSNEAIHSSAIYQDPDNINLAIILYALSKIIERSHYRDLEGWKKFEKVYLSSIDNALISLKTKDIEAYRDQIDRIKEEIKNLSEHLKTYIEEVFRKASINKGSRIYEHGISLEKTAKILGLTIWELNQYIGQTGIADVNLAYTLDIKKRIKNTDEVFFK